MSEKTHPSWDPTTKIGTTKYGVEFRAFSKEELLDYAAKYGWPVCGLYRTNRKHIETPGESALYDFGVSSFSKLNADREVMRRKTLDTLAVEYICAPVYALHPSFFSGTENEFGPVSP